MEITAETVRTITNESGLQFVEPSPLLERLIEQSGQEVHHAQLANAEGARGRNTIAGDQTLTAASAGFQRDGFLTLTLGQDGWKQRRSLLPDQPSNGFTIPASEPHEQIEILCQTWEHGDQAAREMTRILAELAVEAARKD